MTIRETNVRDDLAACCARGLGIADFFGETGRILRRAVPFDGFCSMTVDPATMLLTSHIAHDSVRPEDVPRLGHNEFLEEDVNKFGVLARAARPAGALHAATDQRPAQSPRYRDILRPNGFGDELRFALVDGDACWGWVALYRRDSSASFTDADTVFAASVSQLLAEGVRRAILLAAAPVEDAPDAPGLILLGSGGDVEAVTPAATEWLSKLIVTAPADGDLPAVVTNVAYRALLAARGGRANGAARARVPTSSGVWVTIHGSVVGDPEHGRTAVILEPARAPEMAPMIVAAYGLTPREREVTQLVLQGLSTAEVAARLHLSEYTVQDYLKTIFDKVGVRSRREMVGRIFFEHYVPRVGQGAPLGSTGWFRDT